MQRRTFLQTLSAATLTIHSRAAESDKPDSGLTAKLESIRQEHQVPALAAGRFGLEGLTSSLATGLRKAEGKIPVTPQDIWHLGSMTKAMTATLVATCVQEGWLDWDDTLEKLIPDSCEMAHPAAAGITLRQLLHHRSGLRANLPDWWAVEAGQRERILALAAPPDSSLSVPGPYLYSNAGYVIAGHIMEKHYGGLWEKLIQTRLFAPLKIEAGQGPVGKEGKEDQPWPHDAKGRPLPTNGLRSDNAPSLGPAGRVHASLENYARFAADQLRGHRGEPALLPPALYQELHRPDPDSHYACGWSTATRPWAGGLCLTHTGSNTANFFVAWLAPEKSFGVVAACNQGGSAAAAACDAACSLLIREG